MTNEGSLQKKLSISVAEWDVILVGKEMQGKNPSEDSKVTKLEQVSSESCFRISMLRSPPKRLSLCSSLMISSVFSR